MHEREAYLPTVAGTQQDEPAGLEDDLQPEPATIEVAAVGQVGGDHDRIEVLEPHGCLPG
jgi:hypothetical protein